MTVKEVRNLALKKYKSHKLNSWILGITCGCFTAAIVGLNFLFEGLSYILVPLLVLPNLFACFVLHEGFNHGIELTVREYLACFTVYFRRPFSSSFNVIKSFFKSLLMFIGCEFISLMVCYYIFQANYGDLFLEALVSFENEMGSYTADIDSIRMTLEMNDSVVLNFLMYATEPSLFISTYFFIFFIARESVNIFLRTALPRSNPGFIDMTSRRAINEHSKEFYKAFFGLNWPLFIIIAIGFIGGTFLIGFTSWDPFRAVTMGVVMAFFLSSFFFPFFFANNAALYQSFEIYFKDSSKKVVGDLLKHIESVTEMNEEEKTKFEETMTNVGDPLSDEDKDNKED